MGVSFPMTAVTARKAFFRSGVQRPVRSIGLVLNFHRGEAPTPTLLFIAQSECFGDPSRAGTAAGARCSASASSPYTAMKDQRILPGAYEGEFTLLKRQGRTRVNGRTGFVCNSL